MASLVEEKKFSDAIHAQGNAAREMVRATEKERVKVVEAALNARNVAGTQGNAPAKPSQGTPQTAPRPQGEEQSQAASQKKETAHFQEARNDSQKLHQLLTKSPDAAARGAEPATRDGVAQKAPLAEAALPKPNTQQLQQAVATRQAPLAGKGAVPETKAPEQPVAPRAKSKLPEGEAAKADPTKQMASPEALPKQAVAVPQAPGAAIVREPASAGQGDAKVREGDREGDGTQETGNGPHASTFAAGPSKGKGASKDLGALLGGSAGNGQQGTGDGGEKGPIAPARIDRPELPEHDPHLHVYGPSDATVEMKSKAQLLTRQVLQVEQRLTKIAALDKELDGRIKNLFQTAPFSERFEGDFKLKELAKALTSDLYGYGGLHG